MKAILFQDLIVANNSFLYPAAYTFTGNSEDAKDLVQETLARAIANQDKYKQGSNIRAWLYTIMRNIYINMYRKNKKFKKVDSEVPDDCYYFQMNKCSTNGGPSNINEMQIRTAIHQMPDSFRLSFELFCKGYKYQEIADILGEPLGTIKSRIHFARKTLCARIAID